jgi:hypothetical protein
VEDVEFWTNFYESIKDPEHKKEFFLQSLSTLWLDKEQGML